jgi:Concanavalin A-like lectin/glucanases superfamily/HpiC1 cyclase/Immunoglobulin domain
MTGIKHVFIEENFTMKKLIFGLVLCLSMAMVAQAGIPITVANQSFELPVFVDMGDASANWSDQEITGVDVIPGWDLDNDGANIGVWYLPDDEGATVLSPDGSDNVSYVVDGETAGPWQDLGYTIVAGETYAFSMDVQRNGSTAEPFIGLVFNYHDGGVRAEILKATHDISAQANHEAWVTYDVEFTAVAGQDYIGKSLGIEFTNESGDDAGSWHHIDNAQVEQPYVSGFSPGDGDQDVLVTAALGWELEASVTNCDVYFGDEPNMLDNPMVVDGEVEGKLESFDPSGDMANDIIYYWWVNARVGTTLYEGERKDFTTIAAEPQISEDPCGLTVNAGETAVFRVKATSADEYSWQMLGVGEVGTESTLTIDNVQKVNEGTYWCEVSNTAETVETARVNLMTRRLVALYEFDDESLGAKDDEGTACWLGDYVDPNEANPDPDPVYALDDPCTTGSGKSLQLAADPCHVQITGSADFFNFYPQGYTVNAWVKTEQIGEWGVMASKRTRDGFFGWALSCDDEGQAESTLWQVANLTGTSDIADNDWHMVTGTYNAETGTCSVYVDGMVENQAVDADKAPINDQLMVFGADDVLGAFPYAGLLDNVGIYSYAISPVDVAMLYIDMVGGSLCVGGNPENDLDGDCKVDIVDFAILAADWLECNIVPTCLP